MTENAPDDLAHPGRSGPLEPDRVHDAGITSAATVVVAPPQAPRVAIRVMHTQLQSCGDGEELNVRGEACDSVTELEEALRARLVQLGNCPSAEIAATQPEAILSVGLRIDFPRRRVTALPGRSSSLHNALTYLACARTFFDHSDDIWRLHAAHARYLYYFAVRFGPVLTRPSPPSSETPAPVPSGTPAPSLPAPVPPVATLPPPSGALAPPVPVAAATPSGSTDSPPLVDGAVPLRRPESATIEWERVNLRDAPHGGHVVASLDRGTEIMVYARHSGGWWQTRWRGNWAWIYGQAIGRAH